MSSLNVSNKKTFARKLGTFVGLGLTGLIIYYGSAKIDQHFENSEFEEMVEYIQKLVVNHDFKNAEKLLSEYEEKNLLRPEDKVDVQRKLKKEKQNAETKKEKERLSKSLDEKLESLDFFGANKVLKEIKEKELYSNDELTAFNNKVYDETEEGIMNKLRYTQAENKKIYLMKKYLSRYPQGEHRKKAVKELLINHFQELEISMDLKTDFDKVYYKLEELNNDLKKHSKEEVSLQKIINTQELAQKARQYPDQIIEQEQKTPIITKDKVIVTGLQDDGNWSQKYLRDRNKAIPKNSTGIVITIDRSIYVRFSDLKDCKWETVWKKLKPYWTDKEKNVGNYTDKELNKVFTVSNIKKNLFLIQIEEMTNNMEAYMLK
ncbi:MAG: hypothetical protein KJ583_00750 [Nanoarchaeota archaeon]|nr:hypothetical protein [Nanoarchaeota archaeon]MBU1269618.1 hypothetical protein [Nanoarchaeota archaeon]MBU1603818.1 hypothetical protein [Nanoarchaeota archaeon]MBU2443250.1 hypothetical protein [Nanoarchaeota archaeon]